MDLVLCSCDWGIPGVQELPLHSHRMTGEYRPGPNVHDRGPFAGQHIMRAVLDETVIEIFVDWRAVARALCVAGYTA